MVRLYDISFKLKIRLNDLLIELIWLRGGIPHIQIVFIIVVVIINVIHGRSLGFVLLGLVGGVGAGAGGGDLGAQAVEVVAEEGEAGVGEDGGVRLARLHELAQVADLGGVHGLLLLLTLFALGIGGVEWIRVVELGLWWPCGESDVEEEVVFSLCFCRMGNGVDDEPRLREPSRCSRAPLPVTGPPTDWWPLFLSQPILIRFSLMIGQDSQMPTGYAVLRSLKRIWISRARLECFVALMVPHIFAESGRSRKEGRLVGERSACSCQPHRTCNDQSTPRPSVSQCPLHALLGGSCSSSRMPQQPRTLQFMDGSSRELPNYPSAQFMEQSPTMVAPPPPSSRVEALSLSGLSTIPAEYVRPADERAGLGDAFVLAADSDSSSGPRIPVVDVSPFTLPGATAEQKQSCVDAVRAAATDWGVLHLAGHGIPSDLIDRVRAAGTGFFALPITEKEAYANDPANGKIQGYGSRLAANASGQREWEDYLFHLLHPTTGSPAARAAWPATPPDYAAATAEFGREVRSLASTLLAVLSLGLLGPGKESSIESALTNAGEEELLLQLKINYYPRCPQPELAVGVEAHTDVSALSFILHNGVPGLQVQYQGRWVTARAEPGTLVVHVGDALEILSNGRYTSVLHRGLVNRDAVRVSWVVFAEPPHEAVVLKPMPELVTADEPARFEPRTFREHLDRKLFRKKQHEQEKVGNGDKEKEAETEQAVVG